jgi:hypothetical protein
VTAGALHLHTLGTWHLADASGARRLEPGKPLALLTYLALTPRHRARPWRIERRPEFVGVTALQVEVRPLPLPLSRQ